MNFPANQGFSIVVPLFICICVPLHMGVEGLPLAPLSFAVLMHAKAGISIILLLSNSHIFGALPQEMKIKLSICLYGKQRHGINLFQ